MRTIEGKGGIKATVIADSISEYGVRITTFELEFHRYLLPEFNTHRLFSRNAASSRAIPVQKMIDLIQKTTAMPIHWGKNQPGMSAKEECHEFLDVHSESPGKTREEWWKDACEMAIIHAKEFSAKGYHKQVVNRLLEPFTFIKVVCTATEYDNFFWLRAHPDAQPEIQELARVMLEAREESDPLLLEPGSWHVPYYNIESANIIGCWIPSDGVNNDCAGVPLEDALAISASCCAQVSYRILNDDIDKAREIYARLVEAEPVHASPFEHQASPMGDRTTMLSDGVTHRTKQPTNVNLWSGNFRGWVQHRQLIKNNACWKFRSDR